jgi:putative SOS response-associated peptidase YedK
MCYFNSLIVKEKSKLEIKGIEKPVGAISMPVVSGFEYRNWPIISGVSTNNQLEDWKIEMAEWGLVPYYVSNREQLNTERIKLSTLNARNDNLLNSNIWKNAAHTGRCLILSSGFFEYRHIPKVGKKGQLLKATDKYPHFITIPSAIEHSLFVMAGIKSTWTDRNTGETIDSFAIVTTEANGLMERIHNTKKRMPTILTKSLAEAWISPNLSDNEIREIADYQYSEEQMVAWTVAKDFKTSEIPYSRYEYALDE